MLILAFLTSCLKSSFSCPNLALSASKSFAFSSFLFFSLFSTAALSSFIFLSSSSIFATDLAMLKSSLRVYLVANKWDIICFNKDSETF